MASRYGCTHAPAGVPVADTPPGDRVHVYPLRQSHDLVEWCWCVPERNWTLREDGVWDYIVVHHEGH